MVKLAISATTARANFAPILLQGPLEENFQMAAELGYDAIELHLRDPCEIDWDKTVKLIEKFSLPVSAIGTGAGARMDGLTFTDSDKRVRDKCVNRVSEHLKLAAIFECGIILGSMNGNIQGDEKKKNSHFDCLKRCCDLASQNNVIVLIEPLNRYESDWLNTTDDTLEIIEKIGYPNLKYLADTFHMNIEEADICRSLKKAGKNLGYLHLVDSNRQVPSYGHLRFCDIINTLQEMSYNGILSFECLPQPSSDAAARDAINHLKEILVEKQDTC